MQLSASKDLPGPAFGAPRLSEHTDEVLGELGFTEAEVARLKAEGETSRRQCARLLVLPRY